MESDKKPILTLADAEAYADGFRLTPYDSERFEAWFKEWSARSACDGHYSCLKRAWRAASAAARPPSPPSIPLSDIEALLSDLRIHGFRRWRWSAGGEYVGIHVIARLEALISNATTKAQRQAITGLKRAVSVCATHTHPIAVECDLPRGWDFWQQFDRAYLAASHSLVVLCIDVRPESELEPVEGATQTPHLDGAVESLASNGRRCRSHLTIDGVSIGCKDCIHDSEVATQGEEIVPVRKCDECGFVWNEPASITRERDCIAAPLSPKSYCTGTMREYTPQPANVSTPAEQCQFTYWVTVPPGITKPMSRCINKQPCPLHSPASAPEGGK